MKKFDSKRQIEKFNKKQNKFLIKGFMTGKIFPYPDWLFDRLRPYNVAGFPASLMLCINELCNGKCYDRAMLMQLAFDDCQVLYADIDTLKVNFGEEFAEHAIVQYMANGKQYIVDTSIGLVYDKDYYFRIEQPKINRTFSKEECMLNPEINEIIIGNFDKNKYTLPLVLPMIEANIKHSNHIHTVMYRKTIFEELELFKIIYQL